MHEHGVSLHLFSSSLISFIRTLQLCDLYIHLVHISLICTSALHLGGTNVQCIVFLISNSTCSLFVYRKAIDFCISTLSTFIFNSSNWKHPKYPSMGEWINTLYLFIQWNATPRHKGINFRYTPQHGRISETLC